MIRVKKRDSFKYGYFCYLSFKLSVSLDKVMIINRDTETCVDEIAEGIFRICTPFRRPGGSALTFNQYLIVDDEPLLFHTGPQRMSNLVLEAVASVIPLQTVRWIGLSHHENDEDGGMNTLLTAMPHATPVCGNINAKINGELYTRAPRALRQGDTLSLGKRNVQWIDAPHLPHAWECGYLFEPTTSTLLCGDIFTQDGADVPALTESGSDILEASEKSRIPSPDYYAYGKNTRMLLERLAATNPRVLACMHGSAYRGDGAALLTKLADQLLSEKVL
jgi:flavorubredoxin